ncbi:hypothetical protein CLFO_35250 [Clostridium formicaceticum]|nr:hypothetical protein [Clostridium formicaceticum]ARE89119.1 hypothetical protein CLFO_35250 [Clostridium formicaceticum]
MVKIDGSTANQLLEAFLNSNQTIAKIRNTTYVKMPVTDEVDLLYNQYQYNESPYPLDGKHNLEFAGVWNHATKTIYEPQYSLRSLLENGGEITTVSKEEIESLIEKEVFKRVENYVNENYEPLKQAVTDEMKENHYSIWRTEHIGQSFVEEWSTETMDYFLPDVSIKLEESSFMNYIVGGERRSQVIDEFEKQYHEKYGEKLGLYIMEFEAVNSKLQEIQNDPTNPMHKQKKIIKIMKDQDCQTVNLTINKNNTLFTFKTTASPLKYFGRYISTYHIQAQDRRKFEQLFGRHESYTLDDIAKITYGKRVLYQDEKLLPQTEISTLASIKAKGIRSNQNQTLEGRGHREDIER